MQNMNPDKLRALLEEDTGSAEEAEALLPTIQRLRNVSPPTQSTARLIKTLQPHVPHRTIQQSLSGVWPLILLRAQIQVVRGEIWLGTLLVMTLGVLVTILEYDPSGGQQMMVLLAPIVAAAGVAFIYGPDVDPPLELLLAMPVSPRLVLLARLTLVFGFNLLLGLAASLTLAFFHTSLSFWPLIIAWLAPMTFLSALAFCLGAVSRESLLSGLTCFVLWLIQSMHLDYLRIPDLTDPSAQPWLLMVAALLSGVALWLAGKEEHWIGERQA